MKKTIIKKVSAMLLAGVLATGMNVAAFATEEVPTSPTVESGSAADEARNYTISVATSDSHSYTVYQILTGSLIAGENKLGNPKWGSDAVGSGSDGVDDFIDEISKSGLSNSTINALVAAQRKAGAAGVGTVSAGNSLNVAPGYYLIEDTTANLAEGDAYSLNIVAVFNDITITPKKGTTTSEKKVDDQNDSDSSDHSELMDSADYDIGDSIPYTLTFTLPDDYANYEKYYVQFVDDMSLGLTYNNDAKIYFGASDKTGTDAAFVADSSKISAYDNGTVYSYAIADLKTAASGLAAKDVITIKYSATLNASAVVGAAGNPNKYQVVYNNNPNKSGEGQPTGNTPWDINIVFTYKTVFNKVDGDKNPLEGADFKLEKLVGENWVDVTELNGTNGINPQKTTPTTTSFEFSGLDAGKYKITETKTPDGYNTIDPIEFTITADHELKADNPTLKDLTGTDGKVFTMTASITDGSLTANIENNQGAELPSTGGMGTTIFYVIGGILVLAAAIILISKRRVQQ